MRKVGERAVLYANASRVIFTCPSCKLETSYTEREVSADGVACRSCKRFFLPVVFHKDNLCCAACDHRLEEVHYRQGARVHRFCPDCAGLFDSLVAETEAQFYRWLRGIVSLIRRARRMRGVCPAETDPGSAASVPGRMATHLTDLHPARLVSTDQTSARSLRSESEAEAVSGHPWKITPFRARFAY